MPPDVSLDYLLSFDELLDAMAATKENKAPGQCGISAEVWKHGGLKLKERLHDLIVYIWRYEQMPQNWKNANIVHISKKGSRKL